VTCRRSRTNIPLDVSAHLEAVQFIATTLRGMGVSVVWAALVRSPEDGGVALASGLEAVRDGDVSECIRELELGYAGMVLGEEDDDGEERTAHTYHQSDQPGVDRVP